MNLLIDESVDRQEGHDVVYIAEIDPSISDEIVLSKANEKNALLITADKDFGELVFRQGRINAGVLLVRLAGLSFAKKAQIVATVLRDHGTALLGAFSVVSPGMIRIRQKLS